MKTQSPSPGLPVVMQQRSNDEFAPVPYRQEDVAVLARLHEATPALAAKAGVDIQTYWKSRMGTASALRALNGAYGDIFYDIPAEAEASKPAADRFLGGDQFILDVQTHWVAGHRVETPIAQRVVAFIESVAPGRWKDLTRMKGFGLSEYLRYIFLESETTMAVLTSAPGDEEINFLTNGEIAATRELLDRLAGSGRLLNHSIVHPNRPGEIEQLPQIREKFRPAGWKVYTAYGGDTRWGGGKGWMLDDENQGIPFIEQSLKLGINIICAHKGLSALAATGSPADIGPAAAKFPRMNFMAYHSGYETPAARGGDDQEEGPYTEETAGVGTNRLVKSLLDSKIRPNSNVYAEIGSTWFILMRRPREAAHVIGKLLKYVGEDNVVWGTDSIWYGSPQPLIDAFRTFTIPQNYCEQYGYPRLTPRIKEKVFGLNAARVYKVDVSRARRMAQADDLAWVKLAMKEYEAKAPK